eukprot:TRINITY_DN1031_c0_g1_i1.p1 TRINITY_DN1031_c0_g1~~TRINITY_DN1031_c0_g1_i1.p1  ORF type:complete len:321 (-),score=46.26 TRINITY_DN1031_c0_g1_i1:190-1152(-)
MRPATYVKCMKCNADLTMKGKKRRRCAGCHSIFYDDVACQKEDWAIHKTECKELQRCFIATVRPDYPKIDTMAKLIACPDACKLIVQYYGCGQDLIGIEQNNGLAVFWMTQWMKGGDPEALTELGMMYLRGIGVPNDPTKAANLLRRAANQGYPEAQCWLGQCYIGGFGVDRDILEGRRWLRISADQGCEEAQGVFDLEKENSKDCPFDMEVLLSSPALREMANSMLHWQEQHPTDPAAVPTPTSFNSPIPANDPLFDWIAHNPEALAQLSQDPTFQHLEASILQNQNAMASMSMAPPSGTGPSHGVGTGAGASGPGGDG